MIEFSCHTWAFSDLTLTEALGTIARLGFRYVDLGSGAHLNAVKATADPRRVGAEILNDLRIYNLKLADIYLLLPHIADPSAERRQREIDLFKGLQPLLHGLGVGGVTLSPGLLPVPSAQDASIDQPAPATPDENTPTPYEYARDSLREMLTHANGLAVSIEPHLDSVVSTPEAALQLIDDVPGLQLTVDWAHLLCQNIPHERIAKLLPHARHIQVRQATRRKLQTTDARGKLDAEKVMQALHHADYQGVVCVEYMRTAGWHGAEAVNILQETRLLRDALRSARDSL